MAISIGIPFYNAERFLADAIRSVFAQTYKDWELILIDDGSTDGSLEIAKSVKDPRVRVFSDGKNKKLASRLNEIVKLAKYDLVARMDADDLMSPTRLEKQIKILDKHQDIDLVSTGTFSITDDLQLIGHRGTYITKITFSDLLHGRASIIHAAVIGKKEWFLRNPYDPSVIRAQDYDLWFRASKKNDFNVMTIADSLYYYREEGSASSERLLSSYKSGRNMMKKYAGTYKIPLVLKSYMKSAIVYFLSKINMSDFLLNRRSTKTYKPGVIEVFEAEINTIRNTKVPGID